MSDLHVYAAGCSWHGPISEVGKLSMPAGPGLPCCPHCGSVLFQIDEKKWWAGALERENKGHTNYRDFLRWTMNQKRCWPNFDAAGQAYREATGKPLIIQLTTPHAK